MGNSLLDIIVFGRNAGKAAAAKAKETEIGTMNLDHIYQYAEELKKADADEHDIAHRLAVTVFDAVVHKHSAGHKKAKAQQRQQCCNQRIAFANKTHGCAENKQVQPVQVQSVCFHGILLLERVLLLFYSKTGKNTRGKKGLPAGGASAIMIK